MFVKLTDYAGGPTIIPVDNIAHIDQSNDGFTRIYLKHGGREGIAKVRDTVQEVTRAIVTATQKMNTAWKDAVLK